MIQCRRCLQRPALRPHILRSFASSFAQDLVKDKLLEEAADNDKFWQSISHFPKDPLDDLSLSQPTRYWPHLPPRVQPTADPFALVQHQLDDLSRSIREDLLGTDHPVLNQAASYFFTASADHGKRVRPTLVLLLAQALSSHDHNNDNHTQPTTASSNAPTRRLAEITELIHTASLFHDDVIDQADTRRGVPSVHNVFGNKMAILAGDYLLARASIGLARLENTQVVESMSTSIEHLVRGEVMQLREGRRLDYYLRKTFYKTASLMAHACESTALLLDHDPLPSYQFGKHVGMAFQLVDDALDFQASPSQLGKPALADVQAGLITAPVLFAAEEHPDLYDRMDRKFGHEGDVARTVECVHASQGLERTLELARKHAEAGMDALLDVVDPSPSRDALVQLAYAVVSRSK